MANASFVRLSEEIDLRGSYFRNIETTTCKLSAPLPLPSLLREPATFHLESELPITAIKAEIGQTADAVICSAIASCKEPHFTIHLRTRGGYCLEYFERHATRSAGSLRLDRSGGRQSTSISARAQSWPLAGLANRKILLSTTARTKKAHRDNL